MATRTRTKAAEPAKTRSRVKVEGSPAGDPSYFASGNEKESLSFVSSGCCVLDEALGGGWPLGRISNIVGDKSAGKTLLAMEHCANFALRYEAGDSWIRYAESEAAFDQPYAQALGIPVDRIEFNKEGELLETVEQVYDDVERCLKDYKGAEAGLYIIDSLDALSDAAELGREFDEGSFGGTKPKQIGKMFRLIVRRLEEANVHLAVISQIRDKLNVTFGDTKTRSGGRALDFYATHIVWLAEIKKLTRTVDKVERITGIHIEANVKKNKVGLPFRRARYPVLFGYGIDDLTAGVEWMIDNNREDLLRERFDMSKAGYKAKVARIRDAGGAEARELRAALTATIREEWVKIETSFLPKSRKY